ncbi:MAG: hypothetical protein ACKVI3_16585, partial [Verrucomicrobiia bacterium]
APESSIVDRMGHERKLIIAKIVRLEIGTIVLPAIERMIDMPVHPLQTQTPPPGSQPALLVQQMRITPEPDGHSPI